MYKGTAKVRADSVVLLYHFFHPDDVISARLFSDLAEELVQRGCSVSAMPSVRSCHDGEAAYARREIWNGVEIRRVWRPDWRQGSNKGRVGNTLAMLVGWTWRALWTRRTKHQTVVIGTDPPLSVLVAIPWRLFRPRARIIHWCHDLYPHAAIAEGIVKPNSVFVRGLNALLRFAYARCDVIADLGPCMRDELEKQMRVASGERLQNEKRAASGESLEKREKGPAPPTPLPRVLGRGETAMRGESGETALQSNQLTQHLTLTPWALVEPECVLEADEGVRRELFGETKLGLLYSGNLGRAHIYRPFVELARRVAGDSIAFCYAGRGPRMDALREELPEEMRVASGEWRENELQSPSLPCVQGRGESRVRGEFGEGFLQSKPLQPNQLTCNEGLRIRFAGFASEEELGKRLGAADVHMVSLAPNWTGAVVPSKFFGALAVGRPVLFAGSRKSAIVRWIEEFNVGWVLDDDASVDRVAVQLREFAADPSRVKAMREHCFEVYRREFSKAVQMEKWKSMLKAKG